MPDDEAINTMIARSEEEFEIFQKMDIDRRRQEATEYRRKPRLIEESEIPQSIIEQSKRFTEDEEKAIAQAASGAPTIEALSSDGRRKRKDVNYSADLMSDKEWLKTIDEAFDDSGEDEEEVPAKKKRGRKSGKTGGGDGSEPRPRGRPPAGRKRAVMEDMDESGGEDADRPSSSRGGKRRKMASDVDPKLTDRFNTLIGTLINYKVRLAVHWK